MDGVGELELVTGKNSVCSGCRTARLCSSDCMKAHWNRHKPVCKRIAASNKAKAAAK
jgi:radical SAM protein with 4Fe4S-binding SPASM domain